LRQDNNPPRSIGKPLEHVVALLTARGAGMGRALPCLIRIVAACPRSRLIRVCASHNKTFPGREAFILIQPGRRDPCSPDWPGYAASERPFWMSLAGASGRRSVPSGRDTRSRPATAARRWAPGRSYLPVPSVCPGPSVSSALCAKQANHGSPDRQTHRWPPDGSVRGPTVRSGGPAAAAVARASRGPRGSGPTRADNALLWKSLATVLPIGGCRRGRPPDPPAKLMNPGAR
jgi:hypothetical protein